MSEDLAKNQSYGNLNYFQKLYFNFKKVHSNLINVMIHIICVPLIVISVLRLSRFILNFYFPNQNSEKDWVLLLHVIFTPLFVYVDFFSGFLTSVQYVLVDYSLKNRSFACFDNRLSDEAVFMLALIFCVVMFSVGHFVFEKRYVPIREDLLVTFAAPVYININLLYLVFGYRKIELFEVETLVLVDIENNKRNLKAD